MYSTKCLVILISFIINDVSSLLQRNIYNIDKATGFGFKYHEIPANFTDAFLRCKAEGGLLASPYNELFTQTMISIVTKKKLCVSCAIFTGIHALFSKEDFLTAEGYPLSAIPVTWAPGAPDNLENNEDCIVMWPNGDLDDKGCKNTYPYICYKAMKDELANPVCGNNDKAYALDARTGHCYKFHNIGKNWHQAHMTCVAEGGYLAIPNSPVEANMLKEMFARYPDSKLFASSKNAIGLGFHNNFQKTWLTVKGQTLEEAGYAEFDGGQPDNSDAYDGGSHCGAMFRNGQLDDMWCYSVTFPFICEKDPGFIFN